MLFEPGNFLYMVKQLVTGSNSNLRGATGIGTSKAADGGIKHEVDQALVAVSGSGATLVATTGATNTTPYGYTTAAQANAIVTALNKLIPGADANGFPALNIATGTTAIGSVNYQIPRDYDEASDTYAIRVQIAINSGDVAVPITLKGTLSYILPGANTVVTPAAVTATLPFNSSATALGSTIATYEISFSGNGLKRDTLTNVVLALSGTTAVGPAYVYGIESLYDSTIVSYNETDATGVDGALGQEGNPLR